MEELAEVPTTAFVRGVIICQDRVQQRFWGERTVEPIIDLLLKVPKMFFPVPRDNIFWSFWSFEENFRLVF